MSTTLGTNNKTRFGSRITLAAAGTVEISNEGTFEVENDEIAKEVEDTYFPEFFMVDGEREKEEIVLEEKLKKKAEENELGGGSDDKNDIGMSDDEKNQLIKSLEGKNMKDLRDLAQPFPKEEWNALQKPALLEYLKKQLA